MPRRGLVHFLLLAATLALQACWTPPRSDVQPPGAPRLIADHIRVRSHLNPAVIQEVDAQARTLTLACASRRAPGVYSIRASVSNSEPVKAGERIRATVLDELSVYVLRAGEPAVVAGERVDPDARVLSVDPAYRLLTIQYPDSTQETFKAALDVKLGEIRAGDAVVIHPLELIALRRPN